MHSICKCCTILFSVPIMNSFASLFFAGSDSGYVGVFCGCAILLGYYLHPYDKEILADLIKKFLMIGMEYLIIDVLYIILKERMIAVSGISLYILSYHLELILIAVCAVFLFLIKKKINLSFKALHKIYIGAIIAAVIIGIIYNISIFSFSWGTKRGYIWYMALDMWMNGSLKDKLFGIGPDCFGFAVRENAEYMAYITQHWNVNIANAHNELLQYLCTMGLFGLAAYICIFIGCIKTFIGSKEQSA